MRKSTIGTLEVLASIPGVAAPTGSACHTGAVCTSAILQAMGARDEGGAGAVRWSLGRYTTEEEVDEVASRSRNAPASA